MGLLVGALPETTECTVHRRAQWVTSKLNIHAYIVVIIITDLALFSYTNCAVHAYKFLNTSKMRDLSQRSGK